MSSDMQPDKAQHIVQMMKHAWHHYKLYAWGSDHLRPLSKKGVNAYKGPLAFTLIDSLDTLKLMGLDQEFDQARDYIMNELDVDSFIHQDADISFFETTIRVLGGLLAAHDVATSRGDVVVEQSRIFITTAQKIADRLLIAFETPTGLPNNCIHLKTGKHTLPGWSKGYANMAEIGTNILEFARLSQLSGDPKYEAAAKRCLKYLDEHVGPKLPIPGLYPIYVSVKDGSLRQPLEYTVGACTDSFYEYLLKMWILSGKREERYGVMFDHALDAIKKHLLKQTKEGLYYLPSGYMDQLNTEMQHLTCFAGGMIALNVISGKSQDIPGDTAIAAGLVETGYLMYARNPLFLAPEVADMSHPQLKPFKNQKAYLQRPEVVESIFYMWRLTHDPKYREWNWNIAQAIDKYTRVEHGYSGLSDVSDKKSWNDCQDSYFLAETLKYLYLTFSDDQLLPLDKWVFTTEAHPLSIQV